MNASTLFGTFTVALLAEGVDRNIADFYFMNKTTRSPSSRRAWIEILLKDLLKTC